MTSQPGRMTGQAVSDLLGVTPQWIAKLEKEGFAQRGEDKLFDVVETLLGYIRWLKDPARRTTKTEGAKALEAEKLRRMKIDTAKVVGELVDFDLVETFFAESMTELRNAFGGIPAGLSRDPEMRDVLEKRLNAGFDQYRAAFEAMATAVREGRPALDGDEEGES